MKIDHIGYAVKDINKARLEFEAIGYSFEDIVEDTDRNIRILFGENGNYRIELIAPLNDSGSPVDLILKRIGSTPYHFCYKVDNIESSIIELGQRGYKLLSNPASAIAFEGRKVVFLINKNIGIIELLEE